MVSSNMLDLSITGLTGETKLIADDGRASQLGFARDVRRGRGPSVLAIGVSADRVIDGVVLRHVTGPREAIEMLRMMDFNLLLLSAGREDVEVWNLVQTVRRVWPRLRWVLLSEDCGDQEEILARSLGASSVTANPAVIQELARNRRRNS